MHGPNDLWRVPGAASTNLDGQLALKQPAKLPGKVISVYQPRRRSTAPAKSRRPCRREAELRDKSRERAERKAAERAAKKAAELETLEREWRVQQVAGELGRQADLLERHRHLVAKYGAADVVSRSEADHHALQVRQSWSEEPMCRCQNQANGAFSLQRVILQVLVTSKVAQAMFVRRVACICV